MEQDKVKKICNGNKESKDVLSQYLRMANFIIKLAT